MNNKMRGMCASLALLLFPIACSAQKVDLSNGATETVGPAIWQTGDEDTKVYLFGTVHVLPASLVWRNEQFNTAFEEADTLYLEADVSGQDASLMRAVTQLGFMPLGKDLFTELGKKRAKEIKEAAHSLEMPTASLSKMRPWLAATALTMRAIEANGQDPEAGVEQILAPEAKASGKRMRFFETAEEQLSFMANLKEETQINMLMETARQLDVLAQMIVKMDNAWVVGNIEALEEIVMSDPSMASEELMDVMLTKRNENWVVELNRVIEEEEGVFFVAVGAAHLIGDNSVVKMLEDAGIEVKRVQ